MTQLPRQNIQSQMDALKRKHNLAPGPPALPPNVANSLAAIKEKHGLADTSINPPDIATSLARIKSKHLGGPPVLPQAPAPDISAAENFGNAFMGSFRDLRIGFNELTGDREEAQQLRQSKATDYPTREGFSATAGGALGSAAKYVPAVVTTALAPPVGAVVTGATLGATAVESGGAALGRIRDFEEQTGEDVGAFWTGADVLGNMAINVIAGRFGLKGLGNIGKNAASSLGQAISARAAGQIGSRELAQAFARNVPGFMAQGAGIEALEETAEQIGQNALANYVSGVSDGGLLEGVGEAALGGAIAGAALGPIGAGANVPGGIQRARDAQAEQAEQARQQFLRRPLGLPSGGPTPLGLPPSPDDDIIDAEYTVVPPGLPPSNTIYAGRTILGQPAPQLRLPAVPQQDVEADREVAQRRSLFNPQRSSGGVPLADGSMLFNDQIAAEQFAQSERNRVPEGMVNVEVQPVQPMGEDSGKWLVRTEKLTPSRAQEVERQYNRVQDTLDRGISQMQRRDAPPDDGTGASPMADLPLPAPDTTPTAVTPERDFSEMSRRELLIEARRRNHRISRKQTKEDLLKLLGATNAPQAPEAQAATEAVPEAEQPGEFRERSRIDDFPSLRDLAIGAGVWSNVNVPESIKNDANKLYDAIVNGDTNAASVLATKYRKSASRGSGLTVGEALPGGSNTLARQRILEAATVFSQSSRGGQPGDVGGVAPVQSEAVEQPSRRELTHIERLDEINRLQAQQREQSKQKAIEKWRGRTPRPLSEIEDELALAQEEFSQAVKKVESRKVKFGSPAHKKLTERFITPINNRIGELYEERDASEERQQNIGASERTPASTASRPSPDSSTKQPWEMSKEEFQRLISITDAANGTKWRVDLPDRTGKPTYMVIAKRAGIDPMSRALEDSHKDYIEHAIREGRPVPAEVLADYPDLQAKPSPRPQSPGKGEAKLAAKVAAEIENSQNADSKASGDDSAPKPKVETKESQSSGREKYPDNRLIPREGDDVYQRVAGFGGTPAYIYGKVYSSRGGLRVRVTDSRSMLGGASKGKTYKMSPEWTVSKDPEITRREAATEAKRQEKLAREKAERDEIDRQRAENTAKHGKLTNENVKPGDVLEHIRGVSDRFIVVEMDGGPVGYFEGEQPSASVTPGRLDDWRKVGIRDVSDAIENDRKFRAEMAEERRNDTKPPEGNIAPEQVKVSTTTPRKTKPPRRKRKLIAVGQISDFEPGRDQVVRRGNRTFIVDRKGERAETEVASDVITQDNIDNLNKLKPHQLDRMEATVRETHLLSAEGKRERLDAIAKIRSEQSPAPKPATTIAKTEAQTGPTGPKEEAAPDAKVEPVGSKTLPARVESARRANDRKALRQIAKEQGVELAPMDTVESMAEKIGAKINPKRPNPREAGFVNVEILADTLKAGKWAAEHTAQAAQWLMSKGGDAVKSLAAAARALVRQFGQGIKRFVRAIYARVQETQRKRSTRMIDPARGAVQLPSGKPKPTAQAAAAERPPLPSAEKVREVKQRAARTGKQAVREVMQYPELFASSMIDRIRKVDESIAAKADKVVSRTKQLVGSIDQQVNDALRFVGAPMWTKRGRSIASLSSVKQKGTGETGKWFTSPLTEAMASDKAYNALDDDGKKTIDHMRTINKATGKLAEDAGIKRVNSKGEIVPFTVKDGKVFVRAVTEDLFDIIDHGPNTEAWKTLEEALIKMNPDMAPEATRKHLREMYEETGAKTSEGGHKKAAFEFFRFWPQFPDAIQPEGQRFIQLLHTNPSDYVKQIVANSAARAAFVETFGQSVQGKDETLESDLGGLRKEYTGRKEDFDNVMELLQNRRIGQKSIFAPGTIAHQMSKGVRHGVDVLKSLYLSMSVVPNLAESVTGNTPAMLGVGRYWRTVSRFANNPKAFLKHLDDIGAISRSIINLSYDPNRPAGSMVNAFRELSGRAFGHHWVNESQEYLAAGTMATAIDDFKRGEGKPEDALALMAIADLSKSDAERIVAGKGTEAEHDRLIRRAGTYLVGSNKLKAEDSRWGNSRLFTNLFAFTSYGRTKMNTMMKLATVLNQARTDPKMRLPAGKLASKYLLGTTAQGAGAYFALALAFGGKDGLEIAFEEAEDEPVEFLATSFVYATLFGPFAAVFRAASQPEDPWVETLAKSTFPGATLNEAQQFFMGQGIYKDRTGLEKVEAFFTRRVPIGRSAPAASVMAAVGLGERNVQLEAATKAYWRWRYDESPPGSFTPGEQDGETREFRRHMRKATEAMKRGESPMPHVHDALRVDGKTTRSVASSIRARKLLRDLKPDQHESLRKRIGEKAYGVLQSYDTVLDGWARGV